MRTTPAGFGIVKSSSAIRAGYGPFLLIGSGYLAVTVHDISKPPFETCQGEIPACPVLTLLNQDRTLSGRSGLIRSSYTWKSVEICFLRQGQSGSTGDRWTRQGFKSVW